VQQVGHGLAHDLLGQALDDRGLAHAGLAEQHGVVLGAAAEHLHETLDLVGAADHRVELAVACELGQVAPEAVERGGLALASAGGAGGGLGRLGAGLFGRLGRVLLLAVAAGAEQVQHLLAHFLELQAQVQQHLRRHAVLLAQQAEQQVLGADVVVVQVAGFLDRVLDDLLRPRGLGQLAHGDHLGAALDELLDLQTHLAQVDAEVLQHVGAHAAAFLHQAEQDVLGADVLVVEALGLLVGQGHDLAGAIGETFEHGLKPPAGGGIDLIRPFLERW